MSGIVADMMTSEKNLSAGSTASAAMSPWDSDLDIYASILDRLNCVHISEAIASQGIDDLTKYPLVQIGMGMAYALLLLFGLVTNGNVLLMFVRNRRLRSARNFFLVNLILTDILLCLTAIPITPWYAMTKDWTFGPVMCRLVPLCNSCAVFVTSWSLTAIAIDKHMHIVVEPTRRHLSRQMAALITGAIWLMSILVNIPYLLSFELLDGFYVISEEHFTRFCGKFCDEFNWSSDAQRRFYGVFVLLFQFIVPMAVITFCHARILHKVQKDMIVQNAQFRKTLTNSQRMDAISRKKRVNFTLLGMVVAFFGCNMPLIAVNLAKDFAKEPELLLKQPYLCPLLAHLIAMSIVGWNPLLFFWLSAKDKASVNCSRAAAASSDQHPTHSANNNNNNNNSKLRLPFSSAAANLLFHQRFSRSDFWLQFSSQHDQQCASAGGGRHRHQPNATNSADNHHHQTARQQQMFWLDMSSDNHAVAARRQRPNNNDNNNDNVPRIHKLTAPPSIIVSNNVAATHYHQDEGGNGHFVGNIRNGNYWERDGLLASHLMVTKSNSIRSNVF